MTNQEEAFLTLVKAINTILGNNWNDTPSEEIKARLNVAVGHALQIWI